MERPVPVKSLIESPPIVIAPDDTTRPPDEERPDEERPARVEVAVPETVRPFTLERPFTERPPAKVEVAVEVALIVPATKEPTEVEARTLFWL
jgi:hypothetical protein